VENGPKYKTENVNAAGGWYICGHMLFAYQNALYFLGVSFAFIVSFILLRSPAGYPRTNRLLGVAFLSMGWYNMIYLLTLTGEMIKVYWIVGWGLPLYYLISPCTYLYVRQTLTGKTRLARSDWWHFLPFLITLADMLPFCTGLYMSKQVYVRNIALDYNQMYLQKISFISLRVHFFIRPVIAIPYLIAQWRLIWKAPLRKGRVYRWLICLSGMLTLFYGTLAFMTYQGTATGAGLYVVSHYKIMELVLMICFFLGSILVMLYPEALYGTTIQRGKAAPGGDGIAPAMDNGSSGVGVATNGLSGAAAGSNGHSVAEPPVAPPKEPRAPKGGDIDQYLPVIEAYLTEHKPYLQPKWSIQELSVATRIPLHHLSYIINHHYHVRYTDLMNQHRVRHAKALIGQGAWRELSLEGLAKQSGFANRTNFFLVFKKFTGLSPSEYLNQVKSSGDLTP
jgi:AraC-like DNA-binding protein